MAVVVDLCESECGGSNDGLCSYLWVVKEYLTTQHCVILYTLGVSFIDGKEPFVHALSCELCLSFLWTKAGGRGVNP